MFSKNLLKFTGFIYAATWIVAVFSWFTKGEFPTELVEYVHWLAGAVCTGYLCKSGYENKFKIEGCENRGRYRNSNKHSQTRRKPDDTF